VNAVRSLLERQTNEAEEDTMRLFSSPGGTRCLRVARMALAVSVVLASSRLFAQASVGETQMNTNSKAGAEQRLKDLGIKLPTPPEPFGAYAEAVQTGNLLFLSGMLPTEGREAKFIGRVGAELDVEAGRQAARLATLNGLAVARQHLGSLDRVTRIVRIGVSVATSGDVRAQPKVADGASELLQDVFGKEKNPSRLVYGVASLPLGAPVEVELIFEVAK
jgi:enamine deaminase RidA (YjgF/YER057c/UK114 family)